MKSSNYQICQENDHEFEFLNSVCIDEQCKNRQLLCCYCQENHQTCKTIPLRKFIKQFLDQINLKDLDSQLQQQSDLNLCYDKIAETLENTQKIINQIFNQTILSIIEAKNSLNINNGVDIKKQNQRSLLQKFEQDPSQENFKQIVSEIESFKPNNGKMSFSLKNIQSNQFSQQNIINGKIYHQQYQSAANTFTEQFLHLHEVLRDNIQNIFMINPQKLTEQENNVKPFDKFLSNNLQTSVQPLLFNSKPQIQGDNNQQDKITNDVESKKPLEKSKDNIIEPQSLIQPPSKLADSQEDNVGENETILNVTQEKQFQFMPPGIEIQKLQFINKQLIGGIGGQKFVVYDISEQDKQSRVYTIQSDSEYTDLAYVELDEQNGSLYLATRKGIVYVYIKEGVKNVTFRQSSTHTLDKPGILQIQANGADRQLYSVGEEKIVKIWSMKTMRELKRQTVQDQALVFHSGLKCVIIGGSNFIQIWDPSTANLQLIKGLEQKIIGLQTNETKLFAGMVDKIKIYDKVGLGEFQFNQDISTSPNNYFLVLKQLPMLIILQKLKKRVVLLNYVDQAPPSVLLEECALNCIVREQNKVHDLAFGLEKGQFVLFKMEQSFQQSQ